MVAWQQISDDPNAYEPREQRRSALECARSRVLIPDRNAYLCDQVHGKSLLDIGVVEHTIEATEATGWLHGQLKQHAKSCLGIDIHAAGIKALQSRGFNVLKSDITEAALPRKFDIIVAGEIIEHIDNPGALMRNCSAMLDRGGRLLITTPNPWHFNAMAKNLISRHTFVDSVDHVAWFDPGTMAELGARYGLALERFSGIGSATPQTFAGRAVYFLKPILMKIGVAPEVFAKSIIYEFVTG